MQYLAKCDKCFKEEEMQLAFSGHHLPNNWVVTDIGDLCEECYPKYQRLINEWSVSKK